MTSGAPQASRVTDKTFAILGGFVRGWSADKIGPSGLISRANAAGRRPPLVWVLNDTKEFGAFADALGPDQPLIAMRSLNTVIAPHRLTRADVHSVAERYAQELGAILGKRPFFLGGNCQGAAIAAALARRLLLAGADLRGFAGMEWPDLPPLPVPVTLLFGADSPGHNPFLSGRDPVPVWERIYPSHEVAILPGSHGTYFDPERVADLVRVLRAMIATPRPARPVPDAPALPVLGLPARCRAGERLAGALSAPGGAGKDEIVVLWDPETPAPAHREPARPYRLPGGAELLRLSAPDRPGSWFVQTFRCRAGAGPLAWAEESGRHRRIEVTAA